MAVVLADAAPVAVIAHAPPAFVALASRIHVPAGWEIETVGAGLVGASENASNKKTTPTAVRR